MTEKINIAEILKDCPSGMELYSPLFGDCTFVKVHDNEAQIIVKLETGATVSFQNDGRYYDYPNAECILFPSKYKTTWEGFQCPFKDGDIVSTTDGNWVGITTGGKKDEFIPVYCVIMSDGNFETYLDKKERWVFSRLATEEEKAKLFRAIKDNGYKWNPETKTLEKLIEPKFKVGDRIKSVISLSYYTVVDVKNDLYFIKSDTEKYPYQIPFSNEINYELVPDKFDVINFEPFMKVLVRSDNSDIWQCDFFSSYNPNCSNRFHCIGIWSSICIPYIGNEHLLGTTDDCDDFYKTWE